MGCVPSTDLARGLRTKVDKVITAVVNDTGGQFPHQGNVGVLAPDLCKR